jgi:hypothetical protein
MPRYQLALIPGRRTPSGLSHSQAASERQLSFSRAKSEVSDRMFSCAKVRELQSEAHDVALPLGQRISLWLHTRLCPPCAHAERTLTKTLDLLRELGSRETKPRKK